jgi:hypothetical protein
MNPHPSQYQTPYSENSKTLPIRQSVPSSIMLQPPTVQEKSFGRKINQAFYLTIVFLILSNSYRFINNLYSIWSSYPNALMDEEGSPTIKGYVVTGGIFFIVSLWLLKSS